MATSEARLARLEVRVEEQATTTTDLKGLIVGLDQKMDRMILALDQKMDRMILALDQKMDRRFESLEHRLDQRFLWMIGIQFGIFIAIIAALIRR